MSLLRQYIDVATDLVVDWDIRFKPTGHEAVVRGSDDVYCIASNTIGHVGSFGCGDGSVPFLGFVSAVTVHCRHRATDVTGTPDFLLSLRRGGVDINNVTVTPTAVWQYSQYRIAIDPISTGRFVAAELAGLGVGVEVTTPSAAGEIQVSQLWLELEWVATPDFYDPVRGSLPDAIAGDMAWVLDGTQPVAIVGGTTLQITDTSLVDWVMYWRQYPTIDDRYTTEITTRCSIANAALGFAYCFACVDDVTANVMLNAFTTATGRKIGLTTSTMNFSLEASYFDSIDFDWTQQHHYRLVIDRTVDTGLVRVYVDYDETPVLEAWYAEFLPDYLGHIMWFGTGEFITSQTAQSTVAIEYVGWRHYRTIGSGWLHWLVEESENTTVVVDHADAAIVKPMQVPPVGIWAGQSEACARLSYDASWALPCSIRTYVAVPSALATYNVTLDYRFDVVAVTAELSVQRASDHWYWNQTLGIWTDVITSVTIPNVNDRTRQTFMTNIQTAVPDHFIVKIEIQSQPITHNLMVYKVHVQD